jgi:two-component system chemotaxis response regulator CheB
MAPPVHRDLAVVAASAGGIVALQRLLARVPGDLPAALLVVLHLPPSADSALPRILARAAALPAKFAKDGEEIRPGRIYVAPPDHHLLVLDDQLRLSRGPRQHGHRPAADASLFTAALTAGPRTIAAVLSGALDDGAAGAAAVARHGGRVLVQEPEDCIASGMPQAALAAVPDAHVASADELGGMLASMLGKPAEPMDEPVADAELERRVAILLGAPHPPDPDDRTEVSCPDCGGPIFAVEQASGPPRFECVRGHAWSAESLLAGKTGDVESALRLAAQQLQQRLELLRRLATEATTGGRTHSAGSFTAAAGRTATALDTLEDLLIQARGEARRLP